MSKNHLKFSVIVLALSGAMSSAFAGPIADEMRSATERQADQNERRMQKSALAGALKDAQKEGRGHVISYEFERAEPNTEAGYVLDVRLNNGVDCTVWYGTAGAIVSGYETRCIPLR